MRNDLTDITLVVDRSGSMSSCRTDAEGGINTFIEEQKKAKGDAVLSLVQFDDEYDFVHNGVDIQDVPKYALIPRSMTALLDAVGRAINETGARLSKMAEADRPGCVICVIVTDGHENASKEFTKVQIKELIDRQQKDYNWQFTFLGTDAQSFDEAMQMGIKSDAIATYNPVKKSGNAWKAASSNVMRMRSASFSGATVSNSYSDEEQADMS